MFMLHTLIFVVDSVVVLFWDASSMALGRSNLYYKYNRISAEWLID